MVSDNVLPKNLLENTKCPRCLSSYIWKDGWKKSILGKRNQRYFCRDCGYRFSDSQVLSKEEINYTCQIGGTNKGLKNLAVAKTEKRATGDISEIESLLFDYAWYMKKQGYAESTIKTRVRILRVLSKRGADLLEPESVKKTISEQSWVPKRKVNAVDAYTLLLNMSGGTWNPPRYKIPRKNPFVPTEKEINDLIAGTGKKTSTLLLLLKETGIRIGEALQLKWSDFDFQRGLVNITPEKGSNPRTLRISTELIAKLRHVEKTNTTLDPERVFGKNTRSVRRVYSMKRNRLAVKLQNPRIKKVTFHSIRHWHGTIYCLRHGLLKTQQRLGHRSILNTMKYIHLAEVYFKEAKITYECRSAETLEEAKTLISKGFEYVTDIDGVKLFRKPETV
jgi:integrase